MELWWHKSKYVQELLGEEAKVLFGKDLKGNHTPLGDVYKLPTGKWKVVYYNNEDVVEGEFENEEEASSFVLVLANGDMDILMFKTNKS